jgi:hypothetical protein
MTETLPFALSLSIGFLLIAVFDPLALAVPRWAALLFRISLGSGVGIGFSAIVYLALLTVGFARPVGHPVDRNHLRRYFGDLVDVPPPESRG